MVQVYDSVFTTPIVLILPTLIKYTACTFSHITGQRFKLTQTFEVSCSTVLLVVCVLMLSITINFHIIDYVYVIKMTKSDPFFIGSLHHFSCFGCLIKYKSMHCTLLLKAAFSGVT